MKYLNITRLFIVASVLWFSPTLFAKTSINEQQNFVKELQLISQQTALSDDEKYKKIHDIYQLSLKHKHAYALPFSAVYLAQACISLNRFSEAEYYLKTHESDISQVADNNLQLLDKTIWLLIYDFSGDNVRSASFRRALISTFKNASEEQQAFTLSALGYSFYLEGKYNQAQDYYHQSYDLYKKLGKNNDSVNVLIGIANIFSDIGDAQTALTYYKKVPINDDAGYAPVLYHNMGLAYLDLQNVAQAKRHFQRSARLCRKNDNRVCLAWAEYELAVMYVNEEEYDEALRLLTDVASVFLDNKIMKKYYDAKVLMLQVYVKTDENTYAQALSTQLGEHIAEIQNLGKSYLEYLNYAAQTAALQHHYQASYALSQQYVNALKNYYDRQQTEAVEKRLSRFEIQLKDAQNQVLKKENELNKLRLTKHQSQQEFFIIIGLLGLVVISCISALLVLQVKNRNRYQRMALKDELTDAPNRRAIFQYAKERFLETQHTKTPMALALIDIDHFKLINDSYGHEVGDQVLITFSNICKQLLRAQDRYGRYGGEEWLLVLSNTDEKNIEAVFNRLRQALAKANIQGLPKSETVTFSMGVTVFIGQSGYSIDKVIADADKYLYEAKNQGRNQFVYRLM